MTHSLFRGLLLLLLAVGVGVRWHVALPSPSGHALPNASTAPGMGVSVPSRIVSLAPSITETLYALGLGSAVVGVTQFCAYPPEVLHKPQVAGFGEVNVEAVLRLRPELVALPGDKERIRRELEALGLPVLPLDTRSVAGLRDAIRSLGMATGRHNAAQDLLAVIDASLAAARHRAADRPRPRVLFSVMHGYQGLGHITEITAVGQDGFYSELIRAAGGENVYTGKMAFPRLSREAILQMNPQVIIDVIPAAEDLDAVRRHWQSLNSVAAIRHRRLHVLTDSADTVPGPRFYQTLTRLSLAFHPDAPAGEAQ